MPVFIFTGCEYFENLEFTPNIPDNNQYYSIKGDINGFDEFIYNNESFIFYKESDSGLPEAMFVYVYDGESEVVEAIYFNEQGIPEYYNINGKSVYVENVRGELCDLVVASDDGSFTTLKDIDTDLDIENFWASQQSTRSSSGSAVVGAVNLSNRILGARYLMQGGVDMGFGAYGMIVGCAMLVPGCNVAVGAILVIGGLTGFTSGAMKVVRATDLLVSDGTHTDGAYQSTAEVLDVVSTTCNAIGGASAIGRELANIAINQGVDSVLDNWDKRAREIEMMEKKQRIEAITLTTGESEIDYMNCNVTLKGSLSSTLSSNDYVGIYISEEPATESVLDCDANYAHNGYFSFTFENLERCKTYYYRTYYNSEEFDRTFVGECKEFIIPGVETGEYTKVSDKTYKVSVDAVFGDIVDFAEVGVCYSNENREPTIGDNSSETNPIFSSQNLNFNISTKELPCYYRAYMIIDDRYVIYGDVMCITESDRDILIKFYHDTGGDNWTRNDNWCSDKPLEEWYGVTCNNGRVERLYLDENNLCGGGTLFGCTALRELYCSCNQLTTLDVSGCTALQWLGCGYNQLTSLNLSGCTKLYQFSCDGNQLTSLDVSDCTALNYLSCPGNKLTSLDVTDCIKLETLWCQYNQLTSLDASGCTALKQLGCSYNQLTSLDASGCTKLFGLWCDNNQLISLNLSGCTSLICLMCWYNKLSQVITDFYDNIQSFGYDQRYTDYWRDNDGKLYYKDNGVGWWYPGEPAKGYHGR